MKTEFIVFIVLAVLVIASGIQVFQISSLKKSISGNAVSSNGQLDTTSWTENEIMNYEMHGTIPSRVQSSSQTSLSSGGMVGGC